ncbi:MAG: hypothetical protein LBG88_00225 [Christensenellaceae bacterium]|jgi:hypothetical protein|nr:hypothetical protein [Christensenellaceae bacterium]
MEKTKEIKRFIFLIRDDKVNFYDPEGTCHRLLAKKHFGADENEYNNMVRGTCRNLDKAWSVDITCNHNNELGRCSAAARKFAPEFMKQCKTDTLRVTSPDEEPFIIGGKE